MRSLFALFAVVLACTTTSIAVAQTNKLSVTLSLAGLPGTITLCHDPAAAGSFHFDEQWLVPIDIDNNPNTPSGNGAIAGAEVLLLAETLPQNSGCLPVSASTANSIIAGVFVWNAAQNTYVDSGQTANLAFGANSFTIVTDITGVLANLNTASKYLALSSGSYTQGSTPSSANDGTNEISIDNNVTSPAGDVQNCVAPGCSTSASWYPLIDLVGLSSNTTSPLPSPLPPPPPPPPFGANTLDAEFDLTSLPTSVSTCPGNRTGYGYDLIWVAGINYNASLGVYETLITAHTPMAFGCGGILSLTTLDGTLFHFDPNNPTNGYTFVSNLPVAVDPAHGKILVQADRTNQYLAGLSSSTPVRYFTYEEVNTSNTGDFSPIGLAAELFQTYPQDTGPQINFGGSFTDPSNDVCTSSSSCTSSTSPQIDLIAGAAHMDDYIFRNGFE